MAQPYISENGAGAAVLILGCGYTGTRVARSLSRRGWRVVATTRDPSRLSGLTGVEVVRLEVAEPIHLDVPDGVRVLHSIPVVNRADPTPRLLEALGSRPRRIVYLSTTGVYGDARFVDETTPVCPTTQRTRLRVAAEQAVATGPWTSLILRAAAIYGPERGVHVSMREGRFLLVEGGRGYTSRIHVDDLAAIAEAALLSDVAGAYPVADDEPCTSLEIARFYSDLLGIPMPPSVSRGDVSETRRPGRRVDGRAIRRLLGITLRYPSYQVAPVAPAARWTL